MNRFILPLAFLVTTVSVCDEKNRPPSTPDDRANAVQVARALESNPLGKEAKKQRNWIVHWLIQVPDISVTLCANLLGPILESDKNYSSEIFSQMAPSSAAFIIEHPDQAKDQASVYLAGVEGALRAYESILKAKPKARWPYLDQLIEKRNSGSLAAHIREASPKCDSSDSVVKVVEKK